MQSTIIGPYPRVGSKTADVLRKELNKTIETQDTKILQKLQEELTEEIAYELTRAGIEIPNSGFVTVHDELSWPLDFASGIEFGGMKKIFHTNTHYKEPIVVGEINYAPNENRSFLLPTTSKKVEFPGPYTLAVHSVLGEKTPYKGLEEVARAYARFLKSIIDDLQINSVELIQFNEPALIAYGKQKINIDIVHELYAKLLDGIKTKTTVWTFYGKYDEKTLNTLLSLPTDAVGLDFVWHPQITEILKKKQPQKGIGFGIIDCADRGSIFLEDAPSIVKKIKELEGYIDISKSYVAPNATLEHLPREYAFKKAALTARIAQDVNR